MASSSKARRAVLSIDCCVVECDNSVRLETYYRLAHQIEIQAKSYFSEKNLDGAYIFFKRLSNLLVNTIPRHNAYNSAQYSKDREWGRQTGRTVIEALERVVALMNEEESVKCSIRGVESVQKKDFSPGIISIPAAAEASAPEANPLDMASMHSSFEILKAPSSSQVGGRSAESQALAIRNKGSVSEYYPRPPSESSSKSYLPSEPPPYIAVSSGVSFTSTLLPNGGRQLRKVFLPSILIGAFGRLAESNTRRPPDGIETCGVLAGNVRNGGLYVTHLIIPTQTGTSDTVAMTNEEGLFEYCIQRDLLTLGWIHTHPKQTCFLSSVDLHTQAGFQSTLPEALAIVLAPTDAVKNVGVFRLTEPDGLKLIQRCTLSGFHFHPESEHFEIYGDAIREVEWIGRDEPQGQIEIVDLR